MLVYQPSCVSVSMYTCVRTVCIRPSGVPVFLFVCLVFEFYFGNALVDGYKCL